MEDDDKGAPEEEASNVISLVERRQSKIKFLWQGKIIIELDALTGKIELETQELWHAANVLTLICREELLRREGRTWGKASFFVYGTVKLLAEIGTDGYLFVNEDYIPDNKTRAFWDMVRSVQDYESLYKTDKTKDTWQDVAIELGECLNEWVKLGRPVPGMSLSVYSAAEAALERLKKLDEGE